MLDFIFTDAPGWIMLGWTVLLAAMFTRLIVAEWRREKRRRANEAEFDALRAYLALDPVPDETLRTPTGVVPIWRAPSYPRGGDAA